MTVAVGLAAGLSGVLVALLLRVVQHVAYGYPTGGMTFLEGVVAASPSRRAIALCVAGAVMVASLGTKRWPRHDADQRR